MAGDAPAPIGRLKKNKKSGKSGRHKPGARPPGSRKDEERRRLEKRAKQMEELEDTLG